MEWANGRFVVSDDKSRLQIDVVHAVLARSYWCKGIPRALLERAIENTRVCLGMYEGGAQIGFARVITDEATYAYLCDVFILESHQGKGLGTWLARCIHEHPGLEGLRRFTLVTRDAHGLYEKIGFKRLADPDRYMEIFDSDVYERRGP